MLPIANGFGIDRSQSILAAFRLFLCERASAGDVRNRRYAAAWTDMLEENRRMTMKMSAGAGRRPSIGDRADS
jgi:hypothetical protein